MFVSPRSVCSGEASLTLLHITANGSFVQPLIRLSGKIYQSPVCNGSFVAPMISLNGKCLHINGNAFMQFSRDIKIDPVNDSLTLDPLHYGNESIVTGTINSDVIVPLKFSR